MSGVIKIKTLVSATSPISPTELDQRKKIILKEICDAFICTGEPVGSRTVSRYSKLSYSPATIRNEMQDLEELGYLFSPHTSAGRIPTEKGYKFYVAFLADYEKLIHFEEELFKKLIDQYEKAKEEKDELIRYAIKLAADQTKLAGVGVSPLSINQKINFIKLYRILDDKVMLVTVDVAGQISDQIISIDENLDDSALEKINNFLNEELCQRQVLINESEILKKSHALISRHKHLLSLLLKRIKKALANPTSDSVFLEGFLNFFEQPEFKDPDKMVTMLSLLEQKERILKLLAQNLNEREEKITIGIGSESGLDKKDLSLVTAKYYGPNQTVGKIGLIGPLRMNYARVVSILAQISSALTKVFTGCSILNNFSSPKVERIVEPLNMNKK